MAAVANMENVLSRTLKVPTPKTSRQVRRTAAARSPAEYPPANLFTSKNSISAETPTATADGNRIANAFSPNSITESALSQ